MAEPDYLREAYDLAPSESNPTERAQILATLAIAEALQDIADELRGIGTQAAPLHVTEV